MAGWPAGSKDRPKKWTSLSWKRVLIKWSSGLSDGRNFLTQLTRLSRSILVSKICDWMGRPCLSSNPPSIHINPTNLPPIITYSHTHAYRCLDPESRSASISHFFIRRKKCGMKGDRLLCSEFRTHNTLDRFPVLVLFGVLLLFLSSAAGAKTRSRQRRKSRPTNNTRNPTTKVEGVIF